MNVSTAIAILVFFLTIVLLAVTATVSMLVSLKRGGDERRNMIIQTSCAKTLIFTLVYLLLASLWKVFAVFALDRDFDVNPISTTAIVAVIYLLQVHHYKKKFGDSEKG